MREECQRTSGGHIEAPSKQLGACAQVYTWHPPSPEPLSWAKLSSRPILPTAEHSPGANQRQTSVTSKADLLHCNHVHKLERGGLRGGNGSGCWYRLDILNPGQRDWYFHFPWAWSFCHGWGVSLDVRDSLFKLLLQEFFFFGVVFGKHRHQQAPCHGCAPNAEEHSSCQLAHVKGSVKLDSMCVDHHKICFSKGFDFVGHKKAHCQNSQSENHEDCAGDESNLEKDTMKQHR